MLSINPDLEKKVIAGLLQNESFSKIGFPKLDKDIFIMPDYQFIFEIIHKYWVEYHGVIPEDIFITYLEKNNIPMDRQLVLSSTFRGLKSEPSDIQSFKFSIAEIRELKLQREIVRLVNETGRTAETNGGGESLRRLERSLVELKKERGDIEVQSEDVTDSLEERKQGYLLKESGHGEKSIPFGIKILDDKADGLNKGEMGIVFARTGYGKSRFMFNIAYNQSEMGYKVMYVTLEMYISQIKRLYDSRSAWISYYRLRKGRLTPEEREAYFKTLERLKLKDKNFFVVDIPRDCTVNLLEAQLDDFEKLHNRLPDIMFVDYLTLMTPEKVTSGITGLEYSLLSSKLRQLARTRKIAIFTGSQATRASIKDKEVGTEHMSFSDGIAHNADFILHLHQSMTQKQSGIMGCKIVKFRDGANDTFNLFVDHDHSYIGDLAPKEISLLEQPPF